MIRVKFCDNEFNKPKSSVDFPTCWYTGERCVATKFNFSTKQYEVVHKTAKLCPRFDKATKLV